MKRITLSNQSINLFFFIALGASCLTFRQVAMRLPETYFGLPAVWEVSILQVWIWYEILKSASREAVVVGAGGCMAMIVALIVSLLLYPDVIFLYELISTAILFGFYLRYPFAKILAGSFLLIMLAGLLSSSIFSFLHARWAFADAIVLWSLETLVGVQVFRDGPVLHLSGSNHSIIVEATCSSTWVLVLPVTCFIIVTMCRQKALTTGDWVRLCLVVVFIFLLNLLRLSQMLPSRDAWQYWHFGTGSSMFALASALIVLLLVRGRPNED